MSICYVNEWVRVGNQTSTGSGSHIKSEGMGNSESLTELFSALHLETNVRGRTSNNN